LLDETKAAGTVAGATGAGQWIAFKDADLRGTTTFTGSFAGAGTVEIRVGSPAGRLLGTAQVAPTGGVYSYATTTAPLSRISGRHDVYLVFGSELRLSTFSIR
jgi:beta-glucosidase